MENPTPFQIGPQELINLVLTWESLDDPLAAMQSLGDPLPIELRYRDVQTIQTAQPHHQIHLPIVEEPNLKAQLLIHVRSVMEPPRQGEGLDAISRCLSHGTRHVFACSSFLNGWQTTAVTLRKLGQSYMTAGMMVVTGAMGHRFEKMDGMKTVVIKGIKFPVPLEMLASKELQYETKTQLLPVAIELMFDVYRAAVYALRAAFFANCGITLYRGSDVDVTASPPEVFQSRKVFLSLAPTYCTPVVDVAANAQELLNGLWENMRIFLKLPATAVGPILAGASHPVVVRPAQSGDGGSRKRVQLMTLHGKNKKSPVTAKRTEVASGSDSESTEESSTGSGSESGSESASKSSDDEEKVESPQKRMRREDDVCVICHDNPVAICFSACAHVVCCRDCTVTNFKHNPSSNDIMFKCPKCRHPVMREDIVDLHGEPVSMPNQRTRPHLQKNYNDDMEEEEVPSWKIVRPGTSLNYLSPGLPAKLGDGSKNRDAFRGGILAIGQFSPFPFQLSNGDHTSPFMTPTLRVMVYDSNGKEQIAMAKDYIWQN